MVILLRNSHFNAEDYKVGFIVVLRNIAHDIEADPCRDNTEEESRISDLCMYVYLYVLLIECSQKLVVCCCFSCMTKQNKTFSRSNCVHASNVCYYKIWYFHKAMIGNSEI